MMPSKTDNLFTLKIVREFDAPREQVFAAWTESDRLSQWFQAGPGYTTPISESDLQIGGQYRLGMKPPNKDVVHIVGGEYREIAPPERLVAPPPSCSFPRPRRAARR